MIMIRKTTITGLRTKSKITINGDAAMAEMAYASDLKSEADNKAYRFESYWRHHYEM